MSRTQRTLFVVAGALALLMAIGLRAKTTEIHGRIVADEERFYLPPATWLKAFSLGFTEATADLIWVKSVVYFGERARAANTGRNLGEKKQSYTLNYLATATEIDPRFKALYTHGSVLTLYDSGRITGPSAKRSVEILERGVREFPDDGDILFRLGFLHYYELPRFAGAQLSDAEIQIHQEKGLRMIRRAALSGNAPRYVSLLSSSLLRKEGMPDLVIEHLKQLLLTETNPTIRYSLEQQLIKELGDAAHRDIARSNNLQERWHRELPFVEFDLFLMLNDGADARKQERVDPLFWANSVIGIADLEAND